MALSWRLLFKFLYQKIESNQVKLNFDVQPQESNIKKKPSFIQYWGDKNHTKIYFSVKIAANGLYAMGMYNLNLQRSQKNT